MEGPMKNNTLTNSDQANQCHNMLNLITGRSVLHNILENWMLLPLVFTK